MRTYGQRDAQMQTSFVICPILYAVAMGQIIKCNNIDKQWKIKCNVSVTWIANETTHSVICKCVTQVSH